MKLIELHILQSYPVSCLNRDDVGAPKSALFGGVSRARLSSQCLKRATRMFAKEEFPEQPFAGVRSRLIVPPFEEALAKLGVEEAKCKTMAQDIAKALSKMDDEEKGEVTTAVYLSLEEIEQIAAAVKDGETPAKAVKKAQRLDAADIALFGRMVANDATLNVEAASMFGHALSVHRCDNDLDFFSAVDDRKQDSEDAGAGMIGTLEFNAATYYRYCALNVDLLAGDSHLGGLDEVARKAVVETFLRSVILSVPSARKYSMNADTRPAFVLGTYREKGTPFQLVNAFEEPVYTNKGGGIITPAIDRLKAHNERQKEVWGISNDVESTVSAEEGSLDSLVADLTSSL